VGGKLCLLVNQYGLVVAWACDTANVADNTFQWLIRQFEERMLVETVLSMLTLVCHFKKVMHRGWAYFQARLAFTMAAFNVLVRWHGLQPTASGFMPLSIAEFSL
jgi:hypothetical protein